MAFLEVKSGSEEVRDIGRLVRSKILKEMPKNCRERLKLFMDGSISLKRFMEKIETERLIALTRNSEEVFAVKEEAVPSASGVPNTSRTTPDKREQEMNELSTVLDSMDRKLRQRERR